MICLTPKRRQRFFIYCIQIKEDFFLIEKTFLRGTGTGGLNKKTKNKKKTTTKKRKRALATAIKKVYTTSIRKHAKEWKVYEKNVWRAMKQDINTDLNPLDYAIWDVLENKTNATCHPNIGSLKTAIGKEWNWTSEESVLKASKRYVFFYVFVCEWEREREYINSAINRLEKSNR